VSGGRRGSWQSPSKGFFDGHQNLFRLEWLRQALAAPNSRAVVSNGAALGIPDIATMDILGKSRRSSMMVSMPSLLGMESIVFNPTSEVGEHTRPGYGCTRPRGQLGGLPGLEGRCWNSSVRPRFPREREKQHPRRVRSLFQFGVRVQGCLSVLGLTACGGGSSVRILPG
jgi:hypothetical protein